VEKRARNLLIFPFLLCIRLYKVIISPWLPPTCRFTPTCSQYAEKALKEYGLFYGLFLSIYRILRCQPFSKGGFDPVPNKKSRKKQ
jgi:uncharacterized protein